MAAIRLRRKFITGLDYKNQKAKHFNSGTNKHKKDTKNKRKLLGSAILLLNYGPNEQYCAETGLKLPRNGMAWLYSGKLFKNLDAAEAWNARQ